MQLCHLVVSARPIFRLETPLTQLAQQQLKVQADAAVKWRIWDKLLCYAAEMVKQATVVVAEMDKQAVVVAEIVKQTVVVAEIVKLAVVMVELVKPFLASALF